MSGNVLFPRAVKVIGCLLFVLFCIQIFAAYAEDAPKVQSNTKGNKEADARAEKNPVTVVVTATGREMALEKSTRFMTVVTHEEIERSGKVYLLDLLRSLPGVHVAQSGPNGRTSSVFIRGGNANQTLVMFDNMKISSPTTGIPLLENFTTEDIERIEILRGPQSTLYGSEAMTGVINIIPKKSGKKGIHANGRFEFGTYETFYETGGLSGDLFDRVQFSGSGGRLDTNGSGTNDGYQNTTATGAGKIKITENSDLDVSFRYFNALVGLDDGAFRQDPNYWGKSREQMLNVKYNVALIDWWHQSFRYGFFHDAESSYDPPDPGTSQNDGTAASSRFKLDTDRHEFEYQNNIFIGENDVLTFGYEFDYAQSNPGRYDRIIRENGWYIQNELTLFDFWTTVAGVRIDNHSLFGTEASPLVSTSFWIDKTQTKIKGSFGRGYRAPTMNELFFPNFGNPGLQPESSWGWDAGFEQFFWNKKGSFTAAFFQNWFDDLIQTVRVGTFFQAENVSRALTQGVELEQKFTPWKYTTIYGNYTYTDAVNRDTNKMLLRRPRHEGKAGLLINFWRITYQADWFLVGASQDFPSTARNIAGYTRLDMILTFNINQYLQVYGRAQDINNDHYQEVAGFEAPAAQFFVGVQAKI